MLSIPKWVMDLLKTPKKKSKDKENNCPDERLLALA